VTDRPTTRFWADIALVLMTSVTPFISALFFAVAGVSTQLISTDTLLLTAFFLNSIRLRDSLLFVTKRGLTNFSVLQLSVSVLLQIWSLFLFLIAKYHQATVTSDLSANFSTIAGIIYLLSVLMLFIPYLAEVPDEVIQRTANVASIVILGVRLIIPGIRRLVLFGLPAAVLTFVSFKVFAYQANFINHIQVSSFWLAIEVLFVKGFNMRRGRVA
jgi:hypothetical protein